MTVAMGSNVPAWKYRWTMIVAIARTESLRWLLFDCQPRCLSKFPGMEVPF